MKYTKKIILLTMAAFLFSACGGAVDDGDTAVVVDTTAPKFIKGDPDGPVLSACSVTAEFDDPLLESTINDQSFKIESGSPSTPLTSADGTWGLSPSSETIALFVPSISLLGEYTVTVTTAITNTAGINLETDHTWTFTTTLPCAP